MLKVKGTTLKRFGGFTIKFYFIHCSIPPPNFDTSAICRISAETLIHKAYYQMKLTPSPLELLRVENEVGLVHAVQLYVTRKILPVALAFLHNILTTKNKIFAFFACVLKLGNYRHTI